MAVVVAEADPSDGVLFAVDRLLDFLPNFDHFRRTLLDHTFEKDRLEGWNELGVAEGLEVAAILEHGGRVSVEHAHLVIGELGILLADFLDAPAPQVVEQHKQRGALC